MYARESLSLKVGAIPSAPCRGREGMLLRVISSIGSVVHESSVRVYFLTSLTVRSCLPSFFTCTM